MENNPPISSDRKGKSRAIDISSTPSSVVPLLEEQHPLSTGSERWTASNLWRESRKRAQANRNSWDYVLSSGIAGGIAGCVAKSAIAPLDRVKILFQTSNADFRKYAGTPMGLLHAIRIIYKSQGVRGLYQGHSMTLLRIFPYAGIKYMAYDALEGLLIPTPDKQTSGRLFLAGALSGVTSVLCTYPLELIRVRLAYQTRESDRTSLREAIRTIYREADLVPPSGTKPSVSKFTRSLPFYPFYRGFSISILGMIPYAGVSFLTYGTLKRHITQFIPYLEDRPTQKYLVCGAVAGMVSQTASYPFEVVRRRMQVGGAFKGVGISWREAVSAIYSARGWRGFFVGLSIGYIKVIPMTSISFATWQFMKRVFEI